MWDRQTENVLGLADQETGILTSVLSQPPTDEGTIQPLQEETACPPSKRSLEYPRLTIADVVCVILSSREMLEWREPVALRNDPPMQQAIALEVKVWIWSRK